MGRADFEFPEGLRSNQGSPAADRESAAPAAYQEKLDRRAQKRRLNTHGSAENRTPEEKLGDAM